MHARSYQAKVAGEIFFGFFFIQAREALTRRPTFLIFSISYSINQS